MGNKVIKKAWSFMEPVITERRNRCKKVEFSMQALSVRPRQRSWRGLAGNKEKETIAHGPDQLVSNFYNDVKRDFPISVHHQSDTQKIQ